MLPMSVVEISSLREWEAKHAASRTSGKAVRSCRRETHCRLCCCNRSGVQQMIVFPCFGNQVWHQV